MGGGRSRHFWDFRPLEYPRIKIMQIENKQRSKKMIVRWKGAWMMNGKTDCWTNGWMNGQMRGWLDEIMDRWVDG